MIPSSIICPVCKNIIHANIDYKLHHYIIFGCFHNLPDNTKLMYSIRIGFGYAVEFCMYYVYNKSYQLSNFIEDGTIYSSITEAALYGYVEREIESSYLDLSNWKEILTLL